MKLNLLPKGGRVSSGGGGSGSIVLPIIFAVLLALGGLISAFLMRDYSQKMIEAQKKRIEAAKPDADEAKKVAESADTVRQTARGVLLNIGLAEAMTKHNEAYTDFYDEVRQYIPSWFRLTSMQASPNDATSSTLNLTGTISTYQQYADLMLALMRIPGATAVGRGGFGDQFGWVPNLITEDQQGRTLKNWQSARRPDDSFRRLELDIQETANPDFQGTGDFGSLDPNVTRRGAMPGQSEITVTVVVNRALQTPDPQGTLSQAATLWGPVAAPPPPITGASQATGTGATGTTGAPGTTGTPPGRGAPPTPGPGGVNTGGNDRS